MSRRLRPPAAGRSKGDAAAVTGAGGAAEGRRARLNAYVVMRAVISTLNLRPCRARLATGARPSHVVGNAQPLWRPPATVPQLNAIFSCLIVRRRRCTRNRPTASGSPERRSASSRGTSNGAVKRTRTSTPVKELAPQASASTTSAMTALFALRQAGKAKAVV